jgi:hypothetical protein
MLRALPGALVSGTFRGWLALAAMALATVQTVAIAFGERVFGWELIISAWTCVSWVGMYCRAEARRELEHTVLCKLSTALVTQVVSVPRSDERGPGGSLS